MPFPIRILGAIMSEQPWTIESIRDALGNPALAQRFLGEINRAPAHQLLGVFAKWERIAKDTLAAFENSREIVDAVRCGENPPGDWIDGTERLRQAAERIGAQGAA
jgi:hypothetical protein